MRGLAIAMVLAVLGTPATAATLIADYGFSNSFASSVNNGLPDLIAVDPAGASGFTTDSVFGNSQTVYHFGGTTSAQGGLTFDNASGALTTNAYSVAMTFKIDAAEGFRRLLDVTNRSSDSGFYIYPSGSVLGVYNAYAAGAAVTNGTFHNVALTVASNGAVSAYLDGALSFTTITNVMDINNPQALLHFFLDDSQVGGEWSSGSIAQLSLYDGALSDAEAITLTTPVPEPGEWAMMIAGLAVVGAVARRRKA